MASQGVLHEQLIDLASETQQTLRNLEHTPGAALGTCRYKVERLKTLIVFSKFSKRITFVSSIILVEMILKIRLRKSTHLLKSAVMNFA
jgi:hypothetical protein